MYAAVGFATVVAVALAGMWPSGQQAATPGALELPAAQTMGTAAIAHDHIRREPDSRLQQTMTRKTAEAIIREWLVRIQLVVSVVIRPKCGLNWAATTHYGAPLPASPGCQGAGDGPSPCPGRALECAGGANAEPRPVRGAGRCHERLVLEHSSAENKGWRDRGMEMPGACLFLERKNLQPNLKFCVLLQASEISGPWNDGSVTVLASVEEAAELWASNGRKGDSYHTTYQVIKV